MTITGTTGTTGTTYGFSRKDGNRLKDQYLPTLTNSNIIFTTSTHIFTMVKSIPSEENNTEVKALVMQKEIVEETSGSDSDNEAIVTSSKDGTLAAAVCIKVVLK